jgi:uncharacterized protein
LFGYLGRDVVAGTGMGILSGTWLSVGLVTLTSPAGYQLTGSATWEDIAGVVGLVLCAVAVYAALAIALEDARRTTVLPTGRRGTGGDVEDEAGIRAQL